MDENKKFDCICRICTDESEGIDIYSEEGKKLNLEAKIRKYLYISVYVEDNLPKMVCQDCKIKLDEVHQFATMAVKMQEKLKKCVKMKSDESTENNSAESTDDEHNGSLLHSILTKGQNCSNGSTPAVSESPPPSEVTEVEVRIDPMLFFSCDDTNDDGEPAMEGAENGVGDPFANVKTNDKIKRESDNTNSVVRVPPPPLVPIQSAKELKPYKCTIPNCPRGFNTEIGLQNHLWCHTHANRKVLTSANSNQKRRRRRRATFIPMAVVAVATDAADVASSDETVSNNSGQSFLCPMCGKSISTKGNLKVHLETHRPKGKYGCDICGRIFKTQSNLFRHKEYHGGVQYPCLVCGRVYPTNSTLRAHSITHSTLRPHKCPLCEKTFKRNQDLKFHINQHTGARPYQCPYCPKAFASSGNCFSHRKRMHPTEVERDREMADEIAR